jgi:hypothetical protein
MIKKSIVASLFTLQIMATCLFLMTAVIKGDGGPGVELALKPFHGLSPVYGGGEEGSWSKQHPGAPAPWWQMPTQYRRLIRSDAETKPPAWELVYMGTYLLTVISWISVILVATTRLVRRKKQDMETNKQMQSISA